MSIRKVQHSCHAQVRVAVAWPGPRGPGKRSSDARPSDSTTRTGVWDRYLDGPAAGDTALSGVGRGILGLVVRVGLALFLTAGFAGALVLYAGMTPSSPNGI